MEQKEAQGLYIRTKPEWLKIVKLEARSRGLDLSAFVRWCVDQHLLPGRTEAAEEAPVVGKPSARPKSFKLLSAGSEPDGTNGDGSWEKNTEQLLADKQSTNAEPPKPQSKWEIAAAKIAEDRRKKAEEDAKLTPSQKMYRP